MLKWVQWCLTSNPRIQKCKHLKIPSGQISVIFLQVPLNFGMHTFFLFISPFVLLYVLGKDH